MPCRTTIQRALQKVYEDCKVFVNDHLKTYCPNSVSITFDIWSDKYRRRSYITFTLHYIDSIFNMVNLTLATRYFPKRHTGQNIMDEIDKILEEFGLANKKIYMVTDAGMLFLIKFFN